MSQATGATKQFVSDVRNEMKKASWPTKAELTESTVVIILSVVALAAFVGLSDRVLVEIIRLIVRSA